MKFIIIRIAAALPGVIMLVMGVGWLVQPAAQAESLGMVLLDGVGRSTQIGDMASFFICCGGFIFLGAFRAEGRWYWAGAALLLAAAVFRTVSWLAWDAPFAQQFIFSEVIFAAWLIVGGYLVNREAG